MNSVSNFTRLGFLLHKIPKRERKAPKIKANNFILLKSLYMKAFLLSPFFS